MLSEPATTQKPEDMLLRIIRVADILAQVLVEPPAYIAEEPSPDRKITENCVQKHRSELS